MMIKSALICAVCLVIPFPASAFDFVSLWLTPDQQGRAKFQRDEFQEAARLFENPEWKALSFYQGKDYSNAAKIFETFETPRGFFQLGNSLARMEQLEPAIAAYEKAIAAQPDFPEAVFNLEWVRGLYEQDQKEYDDSGGTGGKLGADRISFDDIGSRGNDEVSQEQFKATQGLSDDEMVDMWMRRVQTTPGDFLQLKFSYQLQRADTPDEEQ